MSIFYEGVADHARENEIHTETFYRALPSHISEIGKTVGLFASAEYSEIKDTLTRASSEEENLKHLKEAHPNMYRWFRTYSVLNIVGQPSNW